MNISDWLLRGSSESTWRSRAFYAMKRVVEPYTRTHPEPYDTRALMSLVDDAYPFGERSMHPYKMWLLERRILWAVLTPKEQQPTAEDLAACEVAADLVELGRDDEARWLLEEQAPRRLNRACPACAAPVGKSCMDPGERVAIDRTEIGAGLAHVIEKHNRVPRVVPHLARVQPTGPLFDGVTQ